MILLFHHHIRSIQSLGFANIQIIKLHMKAIVTNSTTGFMLKTPFTLNSRPCFSRMPIVRNNYSFDGALLSQLRSTKFECAVCNGGIIH